MKRYSLIGGIAAIVLSTAVQTAMAQEPGITDKTIRIGMFSPLSGNAMAYGFDVVNAAKMWYDMQKEEELDKVFDVQAAFKSLMARIASAQKNGMTIENAELIEKLSAVM